MVLLYPSLDDFKGLSYEGDGEARNGTSQESVHGSRIQVQP